MMRPYSIMSGFESLEANGSQLGENNEIADPAKALAYMTATTISEGAWKEIIGTPLTIANYFPRNEASRDILYSLTENFIANDYSVRELLTDVVTSDYFNRLPPEADCGDGPYSAAAVYDPWVLTDPDPEKRRNGPGEAVSALSGRTLLESAYSALEWVSPGFEELPRCSSCAEYSCSQLDSFCNTDGDCCVSYQALCVNINGFAGPGGTPIPSLTPGSASYDTTCSKVDGRGGVPGYTLTCGSGSLTIDN